jgi:hypothetical protein
MKGQSGGHLVPDFPASAGHEWDDLGMTGVVTHPSSCTGLSLAPAPYSGWIPAERRVIRLVAAHWLEGDTSSVVASGQSE